MIGYTCIPNQRSINLNAKKIVFGVKDKILSLFITNTMKDYNNPTRAISVYGGGKKPRKRKRKSNLNET